MADIRYVDYAGIELGKTSSSVNTIDGTVGYDDLVGTATHDLLRANGSLVNTLSSVADRLAGGLGDDYYNISSSSVQVVERAGEGIDTVRTVANYVLADNVEILLVQGTTGSSGTTGIGNGLANVIMGDTLGQMLDGRGGNDVITGGGGGDTFIFQAGSGHDVVTDFFAGTKAARVSLADYGFKSFGEIAGAMTQAGADVRLRLSDTDSITFRNATVNRFTAASFTTALDKSGMKIAFNDEFEGSGVSFFDHTTGTGTWSTSYAWGVADYKLAHSLGDVNGERQIYVDPTYNGTGSAPLNLNPFSVHDGVLDIKASVMPDYAKGSLYGYPYISGLLSSRSSHIQTYGYFEVSAKLPSAKGSWPAFWLFGATKTPSEIDVFEGSGGNPGVVQSTAHDPSYGTFNAKTSQYYIPDAATKFHTYGMKWDASYLTFYVDGRQVHQVETPAGMHQPMYILLNLAVGGIGGAPDASQFPSTATFDYVRAYSLPPGEQPTGPADIVGTADADALYTTGATRTMAGLGGDDTYYVNDPDALITEAAGAGADTVITSLLKQTLADNVENLVYSGIDPFIGRGNALANTITGGAENDLLNGGKGADRLIGGLGRDLYYVDNAGDAVIEAANGGLDTVFSSAAQYTLTAGQEIETAVLTGSGAVGLTGNEFGNRLIGTDGINKLDGGAGGDVLEGLGGNDIYYVDGVNDYVRENEDGGYDAVFSSGASYTLRPNIEVLTYTGSENFAGVGNAGANLINGGQGSDLLNGNGGRDLLVGNAGNDTYVVNNSNVMIVEKAGEGYDTIVTTVSAIAAAANVEVVTYQGTDNFTGYANQQGTKLQGGAGNDTLWGGAGSDTLVGNGGNDLFRGGGASDTFVFNSFATGNVRVNDFVCGEDHIALDGASFGIESMDEVDFVNGSSADASDHSALIYNSKGWLYFQVAGTGDEQKMLIAKFDWKPAISASDFTII